ARIGRLRWCAAIAARSRWPLRRPQRPGQRLPARRANPRLGVDRSRVANADPANADPTPAPARAEPDLQLRSGQRCVGSLASGWLAGWVAGSLARWLAGSASARLGR